MVGMATGNLDEALGVLRVFDSKVSLARYYSTQADPVRVALIVWASPLWVAGSGTFQNDVLAYAGGVNAFSNTSGWASVSPEALAAASPQVILLTFNMSREDFVAYLRQQLGDAADSIPAVSEGRIYTIQGDYDNIMSRPSPRVADAVLLTLYLLHPELYNATSADIPPLITPETLPSIPLPPMPLQQGGPAQSQETG